ncbi:uncharacterized protein B0I36DRAFT_350013 [Microdochium trichocladiopsis]|uniref:Uncharacterized protein n=1 Tax=Microdochium trichocladiopsis TaxID=1682393 RepID=A0A9P8Y3M7_9PEZI|nr:uncharacterized protein B0I36DRAFT_350013 [Microdochium trichocladiopsis]KAH7029071.1 hypothetical protein B0I36DRAFT_350013 [Microdochium trichocladiopsis]
MAVMTQHPVNVQASPPGHEARDKNAALTGSASPSIKLREQGPIVLRTISLHYKYMRTWHCCEETMATGTAPNPPTGGGTAHDNEDEQYEDYAPDQITSEGIVDNPLLRWADMDLYDLKGMVDLSVTDPSPINKEEEEVVAKTVTDDLRWVIYRVRYSKRLRYLIEKYSVPAAINDKVEIDCHVNAPLELEGEEDPAAIDITAHCWCDDGVYWLTQSKQWQQFEPGSDEHTEERVAEFFAALASDTDARTATDTTFDTYGEGCQCPICPLNRRFAEYVQQLSNDVPNAREDFSRDWKELQDRKKKILDILVFWVNLEKEDEEAAAVSGEGNGREGDDEENAEEVGEECEESDEDE